MKKEEKNIYNLYESHILNEMGPGGASWIRKALDAMHGKGPGEVGWVRRWQALSTLGEEYQKFNFYRSLAPKFEPIFRKGVASRPRELERLSRSIIESPEFQSLGIDYRAIYKAASQNNAKQIEAMFEPACDNIVNLLYKKTGGIDKRDLDSLILEPTKVEAINRLKQLMPLPDNISVSLRYYIMVVVIGFFTTKLAIFVGTLLSFAMSALQLGQEIVAGGQQVVEGGTEAVRKLNELITYVMTTLGLDTGGAPTPPPTPSDNDGVLPGGGGSRGGNTQPPSDGSNSGSGSYGF